MCVCMSVPLCNYAWINCHKIRFSADICRVLIVDRWYIASEKNIGSWLQHILKIIQYISFFSATLLSAIYLNTKSAESISFPHLLFLMMPPFPMTAHFLYWDLLYGISWRTIKHIWISPRGDLPLCCPYEAHRGELPLRRSQEGGRQRVGGGMDGWTDSHPGTSWRPQLWRAGCHWCPPHTSAWPLQVCSSWWWTGRRERYSSGTETPFRGTGKAHRRGRGGFKSRGCFKSFSSQKKKNQVQS